jgi:hypothetical protein
MVLVAYIVDSSVSLLQTHLSHRAGHEARRGGLETRPLDQDIEGGHRDRKSGVAIGPGPMHDVLAMSWLRVFTRANTAHLGHSGGQER